MWHLPKCEPTSRADIVAATHEATSRDSLASLWVVRGEIAEKCMCGERRRCVGSFAGPTNSSMRLLSASLREMDVAELVSWTHV
jgi:hypothetical protein